MRTGLLICLLLTGWHYCFAQQVSKCEYFFDTDPGIGNGTSISVSPADSVTLNVSIPVPASLPGGIHMLFVRVANNDNIWSYAKPYLLMVNSSDTGLLTAEYFYDTDPGFGNGTPLAFTPGDSIIISPTITIPATMPGGVHILYVRTKSRTHIWSALQPMMVLVTNRNMPVKSWEYFLDSDPGVGNGTSFNFSPADSATIVQAITLPANISSGVHMLFARGRNEKGDWGFATPIMLNIGTEHMNIDAVEYFIDSDPGIGSANGISFAAVDSNSLSQNINLPANFPAGSHTLYIRSRNTKGVWGFWTAFPFTVTSTLPVTWLEFRVYKQNTTAKLEWKTANEQNNTGFEIQRSDDGMHFNRIGWVNGAGTSNDIRQYFFTDNSPLKGVNFYRLKQIDTDNRSKLSEIRKLVFTEGIDFAIAPNPAHDFINVMLTDAGTKQVRLTDLSGKILWQTSTISSTLAVPLQNLARGIYIIQAINQQGQSLAKKFVKE